MFPDSRTNDDTDDEFAVTMIPSPTGQLEAHFEQPAARTRAIVICHPHPQYGGSMHDAVVDTVEAVARRHAICNAAFNFRGVGASTGRFDNGVGEVDDLLAALAWLRDRIGRDAGLAGRLLVRFERRLALARRAGELAACC